MFKQLKILKCHAVLRYIENYGTQVLPFYESEYGQLSDSFNQDIVLVQIRQYWKHFERNILSAARALAGHTGLAVLTTPPALLLKPHTADG